MTELEKSARVAFTETTRRSILPSGSLSFERRTGELWRDLWSCSILGQGCRGWWLEAGGTQAHNLDARQELVHFSLFFPSLQRCYTHTLSFPVCNRALLQSLNSYPVADPWGTCLSWRPSILYENWCIEREEVPRRRHEGYKDGILDILLPPRRLPYTKTMLMWFCQDSGACPELVIKFLSGGGLADDQISPQCCVFLSTLFSLIYVLLESMSASVMLKLCIKRNNYVNASAIH